MDVCNDKDRFIKVMLDFQNEIEKGLNITINLEEIEQLKDVTEGKFSKGRFKDLLVKKISIHAVFKYIFIRMAEDVLKIVNSKFNISGINNWNEMSKNYRGEYFELYKLACEDLRRSDQTRELFETSMYDNYILKLQTLIFNNKNDNYFEKLKEYDFKSLDPNTAASLFDALYPSEYRSILQNFMEESKITTHQMNDLGLL